jgi:transglycosylase-like protein with SLT domain
LIRLAKILLLIGALGLAAACPAAADDRHLICQTIADAATANGLPMGFLARLLWTESGFRSAATSPAGAEGVAQFMPETALERGLADPRDPVAAIYHAARLLAELGRQFGNLGLAAAAYDAGAARIANWLRGFSGLPVETRLYVIAVTGRPPEDWASPRGSVYAASYPLPGLDCLGVGAGQPQRALAAAAPVRIWQARLDSHLFSAVSLLSAVARSEDISQLQPAKPLHREHRGEAESLCAALRAEGADCEVFGR